jgi:hypothetical protein
VTLRIAASADSPCSQRENWDFPLRGAHQSVSRD